MRRPSGRGPVAIGLGAGAAAVVVALVVVLVREAASPALSVEPAPRAEDPACAGIADRYPDRVAGRSRDDNAAPGVAVWGGGSVVLRCGLEPPDKTGDPCVNVNGVDWVFREDRSREQGRKILITYGRNPAVEAYVSDGITAIDSVLVDISRVVEPIARETKCVDSQGR